MIYKILLFIGVICNVIAQFFLKVAMREISFIFSRENIFFEILKIIFKPFFILSLLSYGAGFFIYAIAISKIELSKAYPVSSVSAIILISILSVIFLSESFNLPKLFGIAFCVIGIFLIFR